MVHKNGFFLVFRFCTPSLRLHFKELTALVLKFGKVRLKCFFANTLFGIFDSFFVQDFLFPGFAF